MRQILPLPRLTSPVTLALLAVLILLALAGLLPTTAAAASNTPHFNVGYRIIDLPAAPKTAGLVDATPLTLAVWYPTTAPATTATHRYGGPTTGQAQADAPLATGSGPYPLLVFSHGYGGGGINAVFLSEALAALGWIVACPDHHDRHSAIRIRNGQVKNADMRGLLRHAAEIAASTPAQRDAYLYRLDEMRQALDGLLATPPFATAIDRTRIAVGGHSFGGYTALGVSGTLPQYHDARIRALLLFSTGAGAYLFSEDELARVKIPTLLFLGEKEAEQKRGTASMAELSQRIYQNLAGPKYFFEVRGANHYTFNNRFSDRPGARLMSGDEASFEVIRRYAIAFLERHVAGRDGTALDQPSTQLTRILKETATAK